VGISIGLVGLGQFGSSFVNLFKHHPQVDRFALCDRNDDLLAGFAARDDLADKLSPDDVYPTLNAICRSDIESLVLITQPWLHCGQAIQALRAGKHVYSAVPLIHLPDGREILDCCEDLLDTVRRTGLHFMYGETTFYRPETQFCRRKAAEGAFGGFVYAEGEYFHDFEAGEHTLKDVWSRRLRGPVGRQWQRRLKGYWNRGFLDGPMHYPTHSTSGPISVMGCPARRVAALPFRDRTGDEFFAHKLANETALLEMANGAAVRICEFRQVGSPGRESFRVYGTRGSFEHGRWCDHDRGEELTAEQMRDPLPQEVVSAWRSALGEDFYGGHGGSHAYLVHEFVDAIAADRTPAINAWQAVRYTAAGAIAHQSALRGGEWMDVPDWGDGSEGRPRPSASAP
jgi:predicted dehydrogenase